MTRTLDEQREEYTKRRFLAMPLAGSIMWAITGASSLVLPAHQYESMGDQDEATKLCLAISAVTPEMPTSQFKPL